MFRRLLSLLFGEPLEGRSNQWPRVRAEHLARCPNCAACGAKSDPEVHHIKTVAMYPENELDAANLITLCGDGANGCHRRIGHSFDWRAVNQNCVIDAVMQSQRIKQRKYGR